MFLAIISLPASPNPIAKRAPIFIIVDSKIWVSYISCLGLRPFLLACRLSSYSATASSSAILAASNGFFVILWILSNIRSKGLTTNSEESLANIIPETVRIQTKNVVLIIDKILFKSLSYLVLVTQYTELVPEASLTL